MTGFHLAAFAALTGLHLALLQFCYFFLLLVNVTSTYVTYMTVVLAWMAGTLVGLWLTISADAALIVGVLSYYLVYGLVIADPLFPYLLPVAASGVLVTGIWAGRFFLVMQPLFGRADRLFLHENNGFLVGIVAVFLGFTLGGQAFLLAAPLLSLMGLLGYRFYLWDRSIALEAVREERGREEAVSGVVRWLTAGQRGIRRFAVFMAVVNAAVPLGIFLYAGITGRDYAPLFWNENTFMTWFSSAQMALIGLVAWLNREAAVLVRRLAPQQPARPWIWWIFMAGFFFLALDERFRIHEQVRDRWLKPGGLFTGFEYIRPGDVGLYFYLLAGLLCAAFLIAELRRFPPALKFFAAAIGCAGVIAVIDALPAEVVAAWPAHRFWESAFEESGELLAQLLFLLSFLTVLHGRLGTMVRLMEAERAAA